MSETQRKRYGGFEGVNPKQEQEFHRDRWERIAAKLNKKLESEGVTVTAEEVMREEAEKDNKQYEKWLSPEYRKSDEQLHAFMQDWKEARDNKDHDPEKFRLTVYMQGAGIQSSEGAAQLLALQHTGYLEKVNAYVGSSGASGPIIYADEGDVEKAVSVFINEAQSDEFFDISGMPKLDTRVISNAMRSGPKAIDVEKFKRSPRKVYGLITNVETRKAELKSMKEMEDPIDVCEASAAIPMFRDPVEIDGKKYMDGAFADVPIEEIIMETKPTHLLICPNKAFGLINEFENKSHERLAIGLTSALGSLSKTVLTAEQLMRMKERVGELLRKVSDKLDIKIAVLWPPDEELDTMTKDPDIMRRTILETYRKTLSDIEEKQPPTVELFPGDMPQKEEEPQLAMAA